VKQRCALKQFIAINDNLEVDARVFISNNQNGEDSKTAERHRERERERETDRQRDRERVCERDNVSLRVKDSVGHKMDSWRKNLVTDMCD
jgi:hypothetical protein